jgi:hypothetical protein
MKISEYIEALSDLMSKHGDLEVESYSINLSRRIAQRPVVRHTKILKGRESKPRFWDSIDGEDRKGHKVVYIQ